MGHNDDKSTVRVAGGGFSISRHTRDIELPRQFKQEFDELYPYHQLYSIGRRAITLVTRTEVINLVEKSRLIRQMDYGEVIKLTLEKAATDKGHLRATPESLIFKKPNEYGNRKIVIPIEDTEEVLKAERNDYLRALSRMCGAKMPRTYFRPEVVLGKTTNGVEPSLIALQSLIQFIPEKLTINPAQPFPIPKE